MKNERKEMIMKILFKDNLWDPYYLFPEKFIGTDESDEEVISKITFDEYKARFLKGIDDGEVTWEDFSYMVF